VKFGFIAKHRGSYLSRNHPVVGNLCIRDFAIEVGLDSPAACTQRALHNRLHKARSASIISRLTPAVSAPQLKPGTTITISILLKCTQYWPDDSDDPGCLRRPLFSAIGQAASTADGSFGQHELGWEHRAS
jgi:hypothetical protein